MITVELTLEAQRWIASLRDQTAIRRITARLDAIADGNLGDWRSVGSGVLEFRIHYGPGYRLYFVRRGARYVLILTGGDKASQSRDIARAKALAEELDR